MNMSAAVMENLGSVRRAIGMTMLRNAMHQDSAAVSQLLEGMQDVSRAVMENSVTPYKGANLDITI